MPPGPAPSAAATPAGATPELVALPHWRGIDFLSDLHLAAHTPQTFDAWAGHLRTTRADAVFILGDLFEAWVGDEVARSGFEARCVAELEAASRRIAVGFMAGNRDFLVGDALLRSSGVTRLADPTLIVAFGRRVLVSHGDALCLDDVAYQRFRAVVRHPGVQRAFLRLPLRWRLAAGRAARRKSEQRPKTVRPPIDLDAAATLAWARAADATTVVHGHTHMPATHELAPGVERLVLSDWELDHGTSPRAEVLRWTAAGFARIPPERPA